MISTSFHCKRCGKEKRVARSEGETPVPVAVSFRWLLAHDVQSAGAMIGKCSAIPTILRTCGIRLLIRLLVTHCRSGRTTVSYSTWVTASEQPGSRL